MRDDSLGSLLRDALAARQPLLDPLHECAVRLFNGFTEGCPDLVIDLYGHTAVIHNYANPPERAATLVTSAHEAVRRAFRWLGAVVLKTRNSQVQQERRGIQKFGSESATQIREAGLLYALNLTLHQDCSFYLDTRHVRRWALERLRNCSVLNAFAYTGSLGVAALGGGARRAIHVDRTQRFLELAQQSCRLNGFAVSPGDFVHADFFREAGRLRRLGGRFDCVFLDPPYFAATAAGVVDLESNSARLINKARPLVAPGGHLVAINNALYLSGKAYMQVLQSLCAEGYLEIVDLLPVPDDCIGMLQRAGTMPITDPAPFNHSTKIAVLRAR
ncbi:MAG TPA: class I SAM-dependent methyltransferase [Anaerolineales bacterium]|nr:class I SAM-dependent methyltransferase [Anaerolineales bacterium]